MAGGLYDEDWAALVDLPWGAVMRSGWPVFGLLHMLTAFRNPAFLRAWRRAPEEEQQEAF